MGSKKNRNLLKTFLNTGTEGTPIWSLINKGVKSLKINLNPKLTEEVYIHQDDGDVSVDSYGPVIPVESAMIKEDAVFVYLDAKRIARAVGATASGEILNVYLDMGTFGGLYLAERQAVAIQFDDVGGDGGQPAIHNYTLNYVGDPVWGAFDPSDLSFVGNDSTAKLSSVIFTGLDLSPQFRGQRIWYTTATDDATNVITVTAVDGDSVITIDNGGDAVVNGAAATWVEGENLVTITSTLGADVALYYVIVTATLGA